MTGNDLILHARTMNLPFNRFPELRNCSINAIISLYLVIFLNNSFWHSFTAKLGLDSVGHWAFLIMTAMTIFLVLNAIFTLFSFNVIYKPAVIIILLIASVVSYYMESYGIVINKQMIINLLETDYREASEQLTWPLFRHMALFGAIPSVLIAATRVTRVNLKRDLVEKSVIIAGSAILIAVIMLLNFKSITLFGRDHRELRMYINPTYPIYSFVQVITKWSREKSKGPLTVIATDATRTPSGHKSLLVLVVGETARAEQFSLNGYGRETNPELRGLDIYNFTDVQSCGTDTAESLPCMFSDLGRSRYSRADALKRENLLDIMKRTGVNVVWLDNNSGSKGVADRVERRSLANEKDSRLCSTEECFDEIMLKDFDTLLSGNKGDMLLVLHQKGSHGPSYYKRSPKDFKRFLPECTQDNVQDCDQEKIVNAYDNTIAYTDHFLATVIGRLKKAIYPTAMFYVSDHGESLGENNIYLHGLPYAIAPQQQTHVPMIFWGSQSYMNEKRLDSNLLREHLGNHFSHDNLFHSLLGLFDVKTEIYRKDMDIFHSPTIPSG